MKATKSNTQLISEGRQFEQAGQWEDAAEVYQRVVDTDPGNQDAVARLLVVYRKLKYYRKELAVIDATIDTAARRDKAAQREWISAHPEAARLGKAVLRQLGGESVTAYGTDPMVQKLMKRRALVEGKVGRRKPAKVAGKTREAKPNGKKVKDADGRREAVEQKKKEAVARKEAAAAARKAESEERKAAKEQAGSPGAAHRWDYFSPGEEPGRCRKDHAAGPVRKRKISQHRHRGICGQQDG
ncbi:MAG TPA: hypothetical protein VHD83_26445 [Puia sp.]|nr:hypothetical protein [Puia sp.]